MEQFIKLQLTFYEASFFKTKEFYQIIVLKYPKHSTKMR